MRFGFLLILSLFFADLVYSQNLCTGNLGDNVFSNGDFGSGTANIISANQGIAPGYVYNTDAPPFDGEYVITNNTGQWPNLFDSWLAIPDNSADPNGYMMVVNASFDPGLFYEQTVTGLCENTLYEFSADIINMIRTGVGGHIEPNVTFLLNDVPVLTTGEIPQDETWHSFGFTFTSSLNQSEIKLSLRNNAPGGIGNDLAIDNISFRACGPQTTIASITTSDSICGLNSTVTLNAEITGNQFNTPTYQWQKSNDGGTTWENISGETSSTLTITSFEEGFNYFRYLLANSNENITSALCRINSDPKIFFVVPTETSIQDTICIGNSYTFDNQALTTSGVYRDTLQNILNCDSVVTLNLTVLPDPMIQATLRVNQQICEEDPAPSIQIDLITNGTAPYTASLNGLSPNNLNQFNNLAAGDYQLLITDFYGCTYEEQITFDTATLFTLDLGDDISIVLGEQVQLNPQSNYPISTYNWTPSFLCDSNCSAPIWFPTDSMEVKLTVTSDIGCQASDSVLIHVVKDRLIQFPTAFSPNGDGLNDFFMAQTLSPNVWVIQSLFVYDRWNNVIFGRTNISPNELEKGWDGTNDQNPLPPGIYPYLAEVKFLDGVVLIYRGAVTLTR